MSNPRTQHEIFAIGYFGGSRFFPNEPSVISTVHSFIRTRNIADTQANSHVDSLPWSAIWNYGQTGNGGPSLTQMFTRMLTQTITLNWATTFDYFPFQSLCKTKTETLVLGCCSLRLRSHMAQSNGPSFWPIFRSTQLHLRT